MTYLDPTTTRLSDSLLLSDVIGCDSVYRYGHRNRFDAVDTHKLKEGRNLGELLDLLQDDLGPYSVCYGYISRELSKKIVTYQDPAKPSYHMWNLGAAVDVCFHDHVSRKAPIYAAHFIDDLYQYSRLITYSESEWLCIGTRLEENKGKSRQKLYENRYIGQKKPKWVQYSQNKDSRASQKANHSLEHEWQGTGHPQYHGGGRKQFEHYRVTKYTHINDFLYDKYKVHRGEKNIPPLTNKMLMEQWNKCAKMAGLVIDNIATNLNTRVSITRAYDSSKSSQNWKDRFTLEIVPPIYCDTEDMANLIEWFPVVHSVSITDHKEPRIQITGEYI